MFLYIMRRSRIQGAQKPAAAHPSKMPTHGRAPLGGQRGGEERVPAQTPGGIADVGEGTQPIPAETTHSSDLPSSLGQKITWFRRKTLFLIVLCSWLLHPSAGGTAETRRSKAEVSPPPEKTITERFQACITSLNTGTYILILQLPNPVTRTLFSALERVRSLSCMGFSG